MAYIIFNTKFMLISLNNNSQTATALSVFIYTGKWTPQLVVHCSDRVALMSREFNFYITFWRQGDKDYSRLPLLMSNLATSLLLNWICALILIARTNFQLTIWQRPWIWFDNSEAMFASKCASYIFLISGWISVRGYTSTVFCAFRPVNSLYYSTVSRSWEVYMCSYDCGTLTMITSDRGSKLLRVCRTIAV